MGTWKRRFSYCGLAGIAAILAVVPASAQDVENTSVNAYLELAANAQWNLSGRGGMNANFIFTPIGPDAGFCVVVQNNNPTSSHTFTLDVYSTVDEKQHAFQGFQDRWQHVIAGTFQPPFTTAPTFPLSFTIGNFGGGSGATGGMFISSPGAARVAIVLAGGTTQTGTPDTGSIVVSQFQTINGRNTNVTGGSTCQPMLNPYLVIRGTVSGLETPGTPSSLAMTVQGNPAGVPIPVSATITPSGTQDVEGTGVAGTPAGKVLTVQGQSGGTNLNVAVQNTPNVAVTNTPSVTVSGTPNVSVTNTPAVTVAMSTRACPLKANVSLTGSGNTQIIAGTSMQNIYLCSLSFSVITGSTTDIQLQSGTGGTCGTNNTLETGVYKNVGAFGFNWEPWEALQIATGNDLCINSGTGVTLGGVATYAKF